MELNTLFVLFLFALEFLNIKEIKFGERMPDMLFLGFSSIMF